MVPAHRPSSMATSTRAAASPIACPTVSVSSPTDADVQARRLDVSTLRPADTSISELDHRALDLRGADDARRSEDYPVRRRSRLPFVDDRGAGRGCDVGAGC